MTQALITIYIFLIINYALKRYVNNIKTCTINNTITELDV